MSRPLLAIIAAAAVSSCAESAGPTALRETLPNGALLVRYPDLPAIDDTVPEVTEAQVDLQFGDLDGDDPNLIFGEIRGVQAASDGTIYVLDYQATEVRAYDPDGRYLRTVARRGEGPGEITEANGILLSGDTLLWMNDHARWVIIGVDPDGNEVRRFDKPVRSYGYIWDGVFDQRGRYWRDDSHSDDGIVYPPPPGLSTRTYRDYYKFHDLSSGAVDSVFLGESSSRSYSYEDAVGLWQFLPLMFEAEESIVVNPSGGFWRANTAEYRVVRTNEEGDTLLVIEAGLPVLRVTDEERDAYVEGILEHRPDIRSEAEEVAGLMPDIKPILASLFVDDENRLWVKRVTPEGAAAFYDRYSQNGDYLGSVRLAFTPAWSRIWVQHGAIYTWVTDQMDVPYVVRAPLS
ncbi:MAG: 6-bladed beta-propeller [Gemmatimonadota bacterium]|nr:6-bladed beta-propeller [Gemmatimonadota bacterium]